MHRLYAFFLFVFPVRRETKFPNHTNQQAVINISSCELLLNWLGRAMGQAVGRRPSKSKWDLWRTKWPWHMVYAE